MTQNDIKRLSTANPFRPFSLRMASGKVHRVRHPDYLFIPPTDKTVLVVAESGGFHILDVELIEEAEVENRRAKAA
jgi:hypothetical protein